MPLVMNTNSIKFEPPFSWTFNGDIDRLNDGLIKHLKKACGYPRHRAWADSLDMSYLTYCEDFARENGLRIIDITHNSKGGEHIVFGNKNAGLFG